MRVILLVIVLLVSSAEGEGFFVEPQCTLSGSVARRLREVEERFEQRPPAESRKILAKLLESVSGQACDEALLLRAYALAWMADNNFSRAILEFERALALNGMPLEAAENALLNLAQLYLREGRAEDAVRALRPWVGAGGQISVEAQVLLGMALSEQRRFKEALPHLQAALAKTKQPPAEGLLQALAAVQFELGRYKECILTLEQLVDRFGKKQYFLQLAGALIEDNQLARAAALLEVAYERGMLEREQEKKWLIQTLIAAGAPQRGAKLLEEGIRKGDLAPDANNLRLLSDAWLAARENAKAIAALERAVEKRAEPELLIRIGRLYLEQERWAEAIKTLNRLGGKAGAAFRQEAYYLKGYAHHEAGETKEAKRELGMVKDGKFAESARGLLAYIEQTEEEEGE